MNATSWPLVTIGTLSYNTGKYVIEALECVKRQNYPNIQHIIIDDCSKDDSAKLIDDWIQRNNYSCHFIKRPVNKGVHAGLTEILEKAQGKYFAMISDDLWSDDKLLKQVQLFETLDDSYAMIYGDTQMIDKDGNIIAPSMYEYYRGKDFNPPSGNIFKEVVREFYFFIQAATISLPHFKSINYFFDRNIISEDWDWQLALSRKYNILGLKEVYSSYRYLSTSIGRTNWTDEKIHRVRQSQAQMLLKYYNHPDNNKEDKLVIFEKICEMYRELFNMPRCTKQERARLLLDIIKTTNKWQLNIFLPTVTILPNSRFVRRISGLTRYM